MARRLALRDTVLLAAVVVLPVGCASATAPPLASGSSSGSVVVASSRTTDNSPAESPAGSVAGSGSGASTVSGPSSIQLPSSVERRSANGSSSAVPPSSPDPRPISSAAGQVVTPLPACKSAALRTLVPGTLTFVAPPSPRPPWFDGDPNSGRGYESAVAAAVAEQLGFGAGSRAWRSADRRQVVSGKQAGYDVAIGEFATPQQNRGAVDYSTGYFSISSSVVANTGTPAARVRTLAGVRALRIAAGGTAKATSATSRGGDPAPAKTYPSAAAAVAALRAGTVDAVELPTPDALTAGPGLTVLGQLVSPTEQSQQFGMVLPKGSPLTSCVSAAIDQLRVTGVLALLVDKWVPEANRPLT